MRIPIITLVVFLVLHGNDAIAQWEVENDHNETFTIRVWNDQNPQKVGVQTLGANETKTIPLVQDAHRIQAISAGGYAYFFRPRELNGQSTQLSVLITPDRKRNGVQTYKYMNQDGYKESDYSDGFQTISRSNWASRYVILDTANEWENVELRLRGGNGTYGSQGQLRALRYRPGDQQGNYLVDGTWHHGTSSGNFEFAFRNNRFDGHYTHNNKTYPWNGQRK